MGALPISFNLNWLINPLRICACPDNSSLAAADSSAVAELVCTTLEIWSIPWVIWLMEDACSSDALEIWSMVLGAFHAL